MDVIPRKIYQSWKTKNLTGKMADATNRVKHLNPEYEYFLYDDQDCRQFLLEYFGDRYVGAFDSLIPGAFKCDFWRYAILLIHGGIYLDIDMVPEVSFDKIIQPGDKLVTIANIPEVFTPPCGIYQAFIAVIPGHPVLKYALELSFYNIVSRRNELFDNLSITGPVVMGIAMNLFWNKSDTHSAIVSGEYSGGIKILKAGSKYKYTYNLQDKKIFKNKYSGYSRGDINYNMVAHYKNDPRKYIRKIMFYSVIGIIIAMFIGFILFFIFRGKWKKCVETCNSAGS